MQHPKVSLGWAISGLEQAVSRLGDGLAERRVRNQFHQLVLAIERDARTSDVQQIQFSDIGRPSTLPQSGTTQ